MRVIAYIHGGCIALPGARAQLASTMGSVIADQAPVIITRHGSPGSRVGVLG